MKRQGGENSFRASLKVKNGKKGKMSPEARLKKSRRQLEHLKSTKICVSKMVFLINYEEATIVAGGKILVPK